MALALQPAANLFGAFEVKGDSIVEITPHFNFLNHHVYRPRRVFYHKDQKPIGNNVISWRCHCCSLISDAVRQPAERAIPRQLMVKQRGVNRQRRKRRERDVHSLQLEGSRDNIRSQRHAVFIRSCIFVSRTNVNYRGNWFKRLQPTHQKGNNKSCKGWANRRIRID